MHTHNILYISSHITYCTTRTYRLNFVYLEENVDLSARIFENSAVFEWLPELKKIETVIASLEYFITTNKGRQLLN